MKLKHAVSQKKLPLFLVFFLIISTNRLTAQPQMAPACDVPTVSAGQFSNGIGISLGSAVQDPNLAIDGNVADNSAAVFYKGIGGGIGMSWKLNITEPTTHTGDVYAVMRLSSSAIDANILGNVTITAFNGTTQVWSINIGSSLGSWFLNIGGTQSGYFTPPNNLPYNNLELKYTSVASLGFSGEMMRVMELRRVPFKPVTNISTTSVTCGTAKTLTAGITNLVSGNLAYQWYLNGIAIPGATANTYMAPATVNTTDYSVVTTIDGQCQFVPTIRKDTAEIRFNACALPVAFETVEASVSGNQLYVQWSTLSEVNNDHFDVEVSSNGNNFYKIGESVSSKAANGNSDSILGYSFTHTITASTFAAGVFAALFLTIPMLSQRRKSRKWMTVTLALLLTVATYSCSKQDVISTPGGDKPLVRIVQVNKDGTKSYSKTIRAF
ncbi:hypothetical protein ACLOAU_16405 [Niabella sp. CJ426]|uniref:hypothetical protein n=1 Tax=Niabella sp. CJ426 TaxID=3393740 RepID=UPI003CFF6E0A